MVTGVVSCLSAWPGKEGREYCCGDCGRWHRRLGLKTILRRWEERGVLQQFGGAEGNVDKSYTGSGVVESTWRKGRRGRGTSIEKNKNILWEIRRERTSKGR